MRRVVYFQAGIVADFAIPDELYDVFVEQVGKIPEPREVELDKARKVLTNLMLQAGENGEGVMGENEALAACFIWYHFNSLDEEHKIDGDILVVDEDGAGQDITYMPLADVDLVEDEEE